VRGYLGRIRASRARDEREFRIFIEGGRRRSARIRERDPIENWLIQSAGAGGRPMAAGSGDTYNPLPYAGGTARVPADLPGHANMGRRIPVSSSEAAAFPANHHSGHSVSNPRRGIGINTNTMRSISELFQRQTGGNVFYNKLN
jgi:hypothetical protein